MTPVLLPRALLHHADTILPSRYKTYIIESQVVFLRLVMTAHLGYEPTIIRGTTEATIRIGYF